MHIQLLTAYFPPDVGSAAHLFYELGRSFVRQGHEVSVITGFPSYHAQGDLQCYRRKAWMRERMADMSVYRAAVLQVARNSAVGRGFWQFSCAASFAFTGLRVPRADVTIAYSPPLPLGLTALLWRHLLGIPFVLNVQDLFPQSAVDLGILRHRPLIRMFGQLEHYLYGKADTITVHSAGNRNHILENGGHPDTTTIMHNSVDVESIFPAPKENDLRQQLNLTGKFILSFAGVMGHSQDLDIILDAAALLRTNKQIHFLLVGDGVKKKQAVIKSQELNLKNVTWLPMQPRDRYTSVLHASDIGLATLHAEVKTPVVPSKILSVMAAGRPVIAALDPLGDAPKLIADAQAGLSIKPENPQQLAEAVSKLYGNPSLCAQFGANGRQYAERHLAPVAIARAYEDILKRITSKRRQHVISQPRRREA